MLFTLVDFVCICKEKRSILELHCEIVHLIEFQASNTSMCLFALQYTCFNCQFTCYMYPVLKVVLLEINLTFVHLYNVVRFSNLYNVLNS